MDNTEEKGVSGEWSTFECYELCTHKSFALSNFDRLLVSEGLNLRCQLSMRWSLPDSASKELTFLDTHHKIPVEKTVEMEEVFNTKKYEDAVTAEFHSPLHGIKLINANLDNFKVCSSGMTGG